jgi:cytochrome c biogenesis protein CcmG/thiol:disulfide interchange protein DsbE
MLISKLHSFLLALLAIGLLLVQGCSEDTTTENTVLEAAPEFNLILFNGENFQLSDQKGKPVLINFFASWCVSCGEEIPVIQKVFQEYPPDAVAFVGIAVDDTEKKAKAFMRKVGLSIPAGLDRTGEIKDAFRLYGMPTTFFIDKDGMVSYFHPGVVTEKLIRYELDKLL